MKHCFFPALAIFIILFSPAQAATGPMPYSASGSSTGKSTLELPEDLSADKIDDILARMSDEQVRELLILELKKEADQQARQETRPEDQSFNIWVKYGAQVKTRILFMLSGFPILIPELVGVYETMTGGSGFGGFLLAVFSALALLAGALLVERLFRQKVKALRNQLGENEPPNVFILGRRLISRLVLDAMSLGVFLLAGFILFSLFFPETGPFRIFAGKTFLAVLFARIFITISGLLLSPDSRYLRLVPVQDATAVYLHQGMVVLGWVWFMSLLAAVLARDLNAAPQVYLVMRTLSVHLASLVIILLIWNRRRQVADILAGDSPETVNGKPSPKLLFARIWHLLAIIYVVLMLELWVASFMIEGQAAAGKLLFSFLTVPIFLALDRIGVKGLAWVFNLQAKDVIDLEKSLNAPITPTEERNKAEAAPVTSTGDAAAEAPPKETVTETPPSETSLEAPPAEATDKKDEARAEGPETGLGKHFITARAVMRLVLLMGLILVLTKLWGLPLPLAQYITGSVVEIFATLFFAAVFWQFIKNAIEKRVQDPAGGHGHDGPGMGVPGSRGRSKTLLLLLKKFVGVVLVVLVSLIVLASLGVNIWPLMAGAGVFGIAIGFGAQSLVRDIITGIFYLTDDAFRIGDYIEAGKVSGSVEHISIRSIRLRHHRGKLQFVPYGQMGVVTNHLRGPIINKFNFRLPLDTDIELFRRIVKKAGKRLEQDPELGPHLVGTVKSQGVKDIDQNALLFRVKLTAMPPFHILAKRTAFNLITEELAKEGIRFPHPNVTVQIPSSVKTVDNEDDLENGLEEAASEKAGDAEEMKKQAEIMAAAGAAALIASQAGDDKKKE